jgi:hypothetical protein
VISVALPRPRAYEMRLSPEFNELKLKIWSTLKDELAVPELGDGPRA